MLLAGDIGGTKTSLAIFASASHVRTPLVEATFRSAAYPGLDALIREFLTRHPLPVTRASLGVAGPVKAGRATVTNLPWVLDALAMASTLRLESVELLNDLEALACAIPHLEPADLYTLHDGVPEQRGTIAVVAPGTGLGEAFLTWNGGHYKTRPSEGGHADFAPTNAREVDLLRYLLQFFDHVSYERVCSGIGIPQIYAFLKAGNYAPQPAWLSDQLASAADPTPVIVAAGLDRTRPCELCALTLETFAGILAAEAGNLALKVFATGGVYLGGGIPPRLLSVLDQPLFLRAFRNKGRMSELLEHTPVHVICYPKVGLLGAACAGFGV